MLFTSLFRRLTRSPQRDQEGRLRHQTPPGRRATQPRRFVPRLTALEDRWLPSAARAPLVDVAPPSPAHAPLRDVVPPSTAAVAAAQQQLRFRESLTLFSVSQAGAATYVGTATYFGHVRAVLYHGN